MTLFRKLVLGLGLLVGVFATTPLFAQGWCWDWSQGCLPAVNQAGSGSNDGGGGGGYVPPTVITLPDSWGAVATDTISGNTVSVTQQASKRVSKRLALEKCGSSNCKVISVYRNGCVAIVAGDLSDGHVTVPGSSENIEGAKSKAMQSCLSQASNCEIIHTECSLP